MLTCSQNTVQNVKKVIDEGLKFILRGNVWKFYGNLFNVFRQYLIESHNFMVLFKEKEEKEKRTKDIRWKP